jgi:DNA-binding NarL/FixJ family response regulator
MPLATALRVLVADDSPRLRRLLRDAIEEVEGVEVVAEAADGLEALNGVQAFAPGVVVLDLQMPVMGGLTALERLRATGERPRVIVLTNHADRAYREACLTAGADHFFDKSAEIDRVLDVLRDLAQTGEA